MEDHEESFYLDNEIIKRAAEQFEVPDESEQMIRYRLSA